MIMSHESTPAEQVTSETLPPAEGRRRANRYLLTLVLLVGGMFGFAYANAEFFVLICQKVGLLAPNARELKGVAAEAPLGREIDVYFSATTADNLPIVFTVKSRVQKGRIGERLINDYKFVNTSKETIYFKPVHDVFPMKAGTNEALVLEACFCFTQQKIGPFESYSMPVIYTFTDKVPEDAQILKMSYTLHRSDVASFEASRAAYEAGKIDPAHAGAVRP
jgi:cytochrome c oxidase assembly protein subunit 11